ncbi:Claspin [Chionoecetes opilio]|uniref:Claspin n=1 Tax=Chionoecetes opilio TaxID=41210 RepID=A0A8J4YGU8_CHIOP|nr:Claspin [Chionoecetes opilio]
MSLENMMAMQPPDQGTGHDETQDAMFPEVEETASKNDESEVKAIDEDSVDADLDLSSRRSKMIILSDDEDSNPQSESGTYHLMEDKDRTAQRKMTVIGSDSESDEDSILFYKKPNTEKPTKFIVTSPSSEKTVYNRDIFDTELSDEDQPLQSEERSHSPPDLQESEMAAPPKDKKKVKKARKSSVKAQQEIQSIHSETQRMVRESRISLPYRRPKQRTLAEFLARRKQTSIAPSIKNQTLKMTMRNMECIRLLEEKKKRVDELYNENSDSDSEDADDRDWHSGQKDDPSGKDETLDSPTVTEESVGEVILPDLTAPFNESSVQEENSQESCSESHTFTSEDEGLGLGASEENTVREHSSPADISQFGGIASTNNIENGMPVTEQINSEDKLSENVSIKTGINTEFSDNEEEGMSEELQTPLAEERRHFSTSNSTDTSKLTPKLKFLSSILPEERLKKIMSITPKLNSGKKADFIDLEERSPLQDTGICEFKDRFMRQTSMKEKPEDKQQLSLNLVSEQDDGTEGQRQVSSSLLNTVDAKQDQVTREGVPGSQFTSFKAALQAKIREQREIHRVRRLQEKQFMETEEIPEDYQNDILPDEEAELTDKSETDYETESEPEENDVVITDHKREKSCYVDDEADEDEDGEETENNDAEQEAGPASDSDDENDTIEATKERKRIIQDPDDDSEEEEHESITFDWDETQGGQSQPAAHTEDLSASFTYKRGDTLDKDASTTSFDSSFELYGSVIAGHQPRGGMKVNAENGLSQFLTKNKSSSFSSTLSTSSKKQELSLPAEDSADIFNNEGTSASQGVLDLNFSSLDSTQPHESNKENESFSKLHLDLGRIDGTQDKDELIGLCSGQFSDETEAATEVRELCGDGVTPTQEINELLGLCSGRFGGAKQGESSQQKNSLGGPQTLLVSQDDHDEDELLGLCTAKFTTYV